MTDPKKKPIGVKVTYKTKTYAKGGPAEVSQTFNRGAESKSYTPTSVETGHPAYGKPGGGTHGEMNKVIGDARAHGQEITKPTSQGLVYKAGTETVTKKPDEFKTSVKINPTIKMNVPQAKPVYAKTAARNQGGFKKMSITLGGSDKKGNPANKSGVAGQRSIRITKSKSFKPPGQR
jgi:hypothetical protein